MSALTIPMARTRGEQCSAGRRGLNKVALFGVILLSCFPLRGAEGVWHRISCTHTRTRTSARRLLARHPAWLNGHIHLRRNSPRASHDCSGRHHRVSWGWFQGMYSTTAGTGGHLHSGARETETKSAVPWLHPDCSKAAVHAPQHQGLGTLPPLPVPVDSGNRSRKSLAQKSSGVGQPKGFLCQRQICFPFRMFS